jgi:two-component system response regulator MprA
MTAVVADDAPVMRNRAVGSLVRFGIEVVAAVEDGAPAWEAILKHEPDLAVLDIIMGGTSGLEVARRIREHGLKTRILLVTSMGQDNIAKACKDADAILIKPYFQEQIAAKIIEALDGILS